MIEAFVNDLLPEAPVFAITTMTPEAIVQAIKTTPSKTSIRLDRWYIASTRAIMITCIMFQWCNSMVKQLNSSPPSMALTTTGVHTCTNQRIVPENIFTNGTSLEWMLWLNSQLMKSLYWHKQAKDITYSYAEVQWVVEWEWHASVRTTYCICHWDCHDSCCTSPVSRDGHHGLEDTYTARWRWSWKTAC